MCWAFGTSGRLQQPSCRSSDQVAGGEGLDLFLQAAGEAHEEVALWVLHSPGHQSPQPTENTAFAVNELLSTRLSVGGGKLLDP
jgi:hypothetical protein